MSPTASIRVASVIPLANSISISVASGTSGSNPLSSSGESAANFSVSPKDALYFLIQRSKSAAEIRYFSDLFRYAVLYEHGGL
jgi:hypothetical protein